MTLIMGIINVTPDSFSDGGRYFGVESALKQAHALKEAGADILDIGAESTRPGATYVDVETEKDRLLPVLKALRAEDLGPLSVDTYKVEIAAMAVENGVTIINDIKGIHVNKDMAELVARTKTSWVLMDDEPIVSITQAIEKMANAVKKAEQFGVNKAQLIMDPGLGFNKSTADNLDLTIAIPQYKTLELPLLYGPSRKRFLGEITGRMVEQRDAATAAICGLAAYLGADIVRVHAIEAVRDAIMVGKSLQKRQFIAKKNVL